MAVTWALVGLIWTVQIVHYPLLSGVGTDGFHAYHGRHAQAITWIVGPLMLAEIVLAASLALTPVAGVSALLSWVGLALVGLAWGATALVSVPLHRRLDAGFDAGVHRRLVDTNWIRTAAWTARGAIALAMLVQQAPPLDGAGA